MSDIPLRDGRTLRRHTTGLGSADGTCRGRVWYFRDVSDIIQSQCALADSEQRYRTAFQTTLDAVAITTLADGVYADVNQAFIDITGYAREEIIGHSSLELGIWADPEDRKGFSEKLRNSQARLQLEARFRKKCGEVFWGMFSVSPMTINGVPGLLSITRATSPPPRPPRTSWPVTGTASSCWSKRVPPSCPGQGGRRSRQRGQKRLPG